MGAGVGVGPGVDGFWSGRLVFLLFLILILLLVGIN